MENITGQAWFRFELKKDLPRTTTKEHYKATKHWLRYCRWRVMQEVDTKALDNAVQNLAVYGQCIISGLAEFRLRNQQ